MKLRQYKTEENIENTKFFIGLSVKYFKGKIGHLTEFGWFL